MRSVSDENTRSAAKRILPAAAMLALSAVMLSTSTYAWFTMNKQVEMTGLSMSATAGDGIEISLASVSTSNAITKPTGQHPEDVETEMGWKSSVIVSQYYDDIGRLKPASSVDGDKLYFATDASNSGKTASKFKEITLGDTSMAKAVLKTTLNESDAASEITYDGDEGYYVDIPVYLRTNRVAAGSSTEGDIYCKLIIKDNGTENKELYKAVRVKFIPVSAGSTTNIYGADDTYYTAGQAVNDTAGRGAVTVTKVTDGTEFEAGDGIDSGLNIPFAAADGQYGHLDFLVRVWLEGESTFCFDENSGQSWNIDLAFSLDKFASDQNTGA